MEPWEIVRDPGAAAALLQPDRGRVLAELAEPDSAAGVARRLGLPRQKVNYHLRELERERLVTPVRERRRGNCVERVVRATALAYVISPDALGPLGKGSPFEADRFAVPHLIRTAADAIRDLGRLVVKAAKSGKRISTLTIRTDIRFKSPADRDAFAGELAGAVARLAAKYDSPKPGSRAFRVFVGAYPASRELPKKGTPP